MPERKLTCPFYTEEARKMFQIKYIKVECFDYFPLSESDFYRKYSKTFL